MKKLISIAISALFMSNISIANAENSLFQDIQAKVEAKKKTQGENTVEKINDNSGLTNTATKVAQTNTTITNPLSINNKPTNNTLSKDILEIKKSNDNNQEVKINSNNSTIVKPTLNSGLASTVSPDIADIKPEIKKNEIPTMPEMKKEVDSVNQLGEVVKESKHEVKKEITVPKKLTKKPIKKAKAVKKPIVKSNDVKKEINKNEIDLPKTKASDDEYLMNQSKYILAQNVDLDFKDLNSKITVSLKDSKGNIIPENQFKNNTIKLLTLSSDLKTIATQENEINVENNEYEFKKEINTCAAYFIQYELKSSAEPNNLVKYIDSTGKWTNNFDSKCNTENVNLDNGTDVDYSLDNNLSGLILSSDKLNYNQPIKFNVVYSKFGRNRYPKNLTVFALKTDFSEIKLINPKQIGNAVSGATYETYLNKGNYILGYTFTEGRKEIYLQTINVE